jgi:YidC/Oxa1 family membrane protein insertase
MNFIFSSVKVITLPLTTSQLESTTKMQKLQPLQAKIQQTYASDEQTKNQLMVELYQAAQVNPLAGCFPALVQIPIFISLYRALLNLVAENKLDEPFLWIPDLEGPVYTSPPGESLDWFKSLFSGEPKLGFEDTFAFLTLPIILFITQKISQKILQPPRDPNKILTEQEEFSQGLLNNLPFVIAFFSLNVPAGLAVYWIVNNILTTVITIVVKNQIKDEKVPREVEMIMASVAKASATKGNVDSYPKISSKSAEFLRNEEKFQSKKPSGFGNLDLVDTTIKSQNPLASENMWNKPSETTSSIEMKPVDVTNVVEEDNSNDDDDDNDDEKTTEVTTDATSRSSKQRRKQKRGGKKTSGKK